MNNVNVAQTYQLDGDSITMELLWEMTNNSQAQFQIAESSRKKVLASRQYIEARIKQGDVMYGVNTGFGAFSSNTSMRIPL